MALNSKIEWTHHSFNFWFGCTERHLGCDNCYARVMMQDRYKKTKWGEDEPRLEKVKPFKGLMAFQNKAEKANEVHKVFVGSLMDIFEDSKPMVNNKGEILENETGHIRNVFFEKISNNEYPNLYFLFLTKRPQNINRMIPKSWLLQPPKNVSFGTSASDQITYHKYINLLTKVKGSIYMSIEPQVKEIELDYRVAKLDWIIQGGESKQGGKKRPFDIKWAYKMMEQSNFNYCPYFFKQVDENKNNIPEIFITKREEHLGYQNYKNGIKKKK